MLQRELSAILSACIKLPVAIKMFCLFLSGRFTQVYCTCILGFTVYQTVHLRVCQCTLANPYPANIFVLKMLSAAYTCIQVHFRLDFIMEANTMNPDQSSLICVHIVYNMSRDMRFPTMWYVRPAKPGSKGYQQTTLGGKELRIQEKGLVKNMYDLTNRDRIYCLWCGYICYRYLTSILCNHQKIPIGPRHGPTRNWIKLSQNGQYHSGIGKQLSKVCYQRSLPW